MTHTDALFGTQSQSILHDLVTLLGQSSAWNCSDPERRETAIQRVLVMIKRAPANVHYLWLFGEHVLTRSLTARVQVFGRRL